MYDRDLSPKHVEGDTGSPPYPASTPIDDEQLQRDHHLQQDDETSGESAQPIMIAPCAKVQEQDENGTLCDKSEIHLKDSISRLDGQSIQAIPPPPMPFEGTVTLLQMYSYRSL